jgi:hypothetical protein
MQNRFDIAEHMKYQRKQAWGSLMPGDVVEYARDNNQRWMYAGYTNNGPPGTCGEKNYVFYNVDDTNKLLYVCPSPVANGLSGNNENGEMRFISADLDSFTIIGHLSPREWKRITEQKGKMSLEKAASTPTK